MASEPTQPLRGLARVGQSVWIDYLSRELLDNGELARLGREKAVVGVTSKPTIFEHAISNGDANDARRSRSQAAATSVQASSQKSCRAGSRRGKNSRNCGCARRATQLGEREWEPLDAEARRVVEAAVAFAKVGTDPKPEGALLNIYAETER